MRKNEDHLSAARRRKVLFALHFAFYAIFWALAFIFSVSYRGAMTVVSSPAFIMLLWSPLFILHLANYSRAEAQTSSASDDRAAYREGFRDAAQMLRDRYDDDTIERLGLDDEGELVPLVAGKRKHQD